MPNWTNEQLRAINESGKNIIVSAGAGSGKTAVLTQRVITKIKSGVSIKKLLILTFTNAAANEMKERIRSSLEKDESLKSELDYLDSAYITTFDSFAMCLVKKYYYVLNISPNINIIDKTIIDSIKSKYLDSIFDRMYEKKDTSFMNFINDLTIKDDTYIKKSILLVNEKLDRLIDKKDYLSNYIHNYYTEKNINNLISEFNNYLLKKLQTIKELTKEAQFYSQEYYLSISNFLNDLICSKTYDELLKYIDVKLPNLKRNAEAQLKNIKDKINEKLKDLKSILIYRNTEHIKNTLLSTRCYATSIIDIISHLDELINNYKKYHNHYEFNDIALMAIKLINENKEIKNEIISSFEEIMVDEYQDTSDIQECLISLISNNNLYMVGDIKQSIYRFRNANPEIFKNKYNEYLNNLNGIKIDLSSNFRSRCEVLENINNIFKYVMDDDIGGCNYNNEHQMLFANQNYEINKTNQNYNLEIYNYKKQDKKFSTGEYEAFIIANDIKTKINSRYQVLDKKTNALRDAKYDDFCILIDRKTNFELYKKIFEYSGVPLLIYYDENITTESDVLLLKNIIDIIVKIYNKNFDVKFKYDFYSIARSFLYEMDENEYLNYFTNNNFNDSEIYIKCKEIAMNLDYMSNIDLVDQIIENFNMYENAIKIGDIEKFIIHIDYIKKIACDLSSLGYSILDFNNYLNEMTTNKSDISYCLNTKADNNVKLMNIHKSKGLEFPICYYAGLENKFNRTELNDKINFDKDYGLVLPFYDAGLGNTIIHTLFKNKYNLEDISERVRLFYVSLTRAKEKMIIIANLNDEVVELTNELKYNYHSFLDIIKSIKNYLKEYILDTDNPYLTKEYDKNITKKCNIKKDSKKILTKEIYLDNNKINKSQVSKDIISIIEKEQQEALNYGVKLHRLLEASDFKNSGNKTVKKFINNFPNIKNAKLYKEHEFIWDDENTEYHGIIDLIIEYDNCIDIVDYKTKNISDDSYIKQLNIYKEYLSSKTNKKVSAYLYSIFNNELKEIK